jgi:xanthine dehydrogenase YagR molybdenum-binding subunit
MKLDGPIGHTVLDDDPGLVGAPIDRVDGAAKITGTARYAYEWPHDAPLYGYAVQAAAASGTITALDTQAAERAPGVRLVLTYKNAPPQGTGDHRRFAGQLTGPEIMSWGQAIALVVADTFEEARAAAYLVRATYSRQPAELSMHDSAGQAVTPQDGELKADSAVGQFDTAFDSAPVKLDEVYSTPMQSHAAMEPHATIARWDGDMLTLETANQSPDLGRDSVANTLKMPKEKVRLIAKYIGGGFGGKGFVLGDAILAAIAARQTGRTVKVALARPQVFGVTTHRSATVQRVRLGAQTDGTLVAVGHDSLSANRDGQQKFETAAVQTRALYAGDNRLTRHRQVGLDIPLASSMRAPGEAVGLLALEGAMDELAEKLNIDPIELRIRNEPMEDPERKVPFSSRNLVPCLKAGAELFGWSRRGGPATQTNGRWLVGMGVAAAIRGNNLRKSDARVRLDPDGTLTAQMAMTDLGTGTYTILTQLAATLLGLPMDKVRVELGDTDLPMSSGSGGSVGAGSNGSALYDACMGLRRQVAQAAGFDPARARFADGNVSLDGTAKPLAGLVPPGGLVADGTLDPGDQMKRYSQHSYGAQFAEVGVDRDTGEVRLRRMLGVFTAGRILNAKTARSQAIGGMIFGVGAALHEDLVMDERTGAFVNNSLAEYHVPVHADIPAIDAVFLPELDPDSNPLKSKGVGELGICGAGAAVANAVYNATGVRIREYPLTLDKVLAGMEQRA